MWLKNKLAQYLEKQEQAKNDNYEDHDEWNLTQPKISWDIWLYLQAFDWKFLPVEGSLLDQPEWLMDDLATISWQYSIVKDQLDAAKED
jgi:hypothetical protein